MVVAVQDSCTYAGTKLCLNNHYLCETFCLGWTVHHCNTTPMWGLISLLVLIEHLSQLAWMPTYAGAREPGGGGKGGNCPPNFLSQWDGYACPPPPKIWQSLGISTLLPPKNKIVPAPLNIWHCHQRLQTPVYLESLL